MTEKKKPKFTTDETLPVIPMNEPAAPFTYPLATASALSDDAKQMYLYGRSGKLDRDVFDPKKRRGFVSPAEAKEFQPTERMLKAITELEDINLARYSSKYGHNLIVTPVHEHYTFARGRGSQIIKVSTFEKYPESSQLLAVLLGGDLETREVHGGLTEIAVRSRHETATDFGHSASSTALLTVRNASAPIFSGYGRMTFHGVLTEALLYPIGVDPLTVDDGDTTPGNTCTDARCTSHPFAPYMPPTVDSLDGARFVTVEVLPMRPYLVVAPPPFEDALA